MRTAFFRTLMRLAETDERIVLVVGDLGFGVVEPFAARFPGRFVNAGVAEQNMTAIAAGLALEGKTVFTYSIGNFPTLRCLEQIRNDVCYHGANVIVVAVGGGFAYGPLGMTHHATEDLAVLRSMPGMTVVAPGDPVETEHATRAVAQRRGPCYLRLGRAGEPTIHTGPVAFELGKALRVQDGQDLTLVSTGGMLATAVEAARRLGAQRLSVRVLSAHTLKPFDGAVVVRAAEETGLVVTIEEHSIVGGLGSAAAEALADSGVSRPYRIKRIGLSAFAKRIGSQDWLKAEHGLSADAIVETVRGLLDRATMPRREGSVLA